MASQIPIDPAAVAGRSRPGGVIELAPDLAYLRTIFVNVVLLGTPERWLLVDAGMPGFASKITAAATARFGEVPPSAILLTHGHFDHVGSLSTLLKRWDVPLYAHVEEHPFLDGTRPYPPPTPRFRDGLMSLSSPLFPRGPFDFRPWLRALPADGSVPEMAEWRWIATPGHAPGHVSFWREEGRRLIAGDAFVATEQEALFAALTQRPEMHGPPRYFTPDWTAAEASVHRLSALQPDLAITGHGPALEGAPLRVALDRLALDFRAVAPPR